MSTQQDIYVAGSESRPPMLNKENYMPWSSRLLRYAKSRTIGKLIHNSIINGPYVRRMIPEPGDTNRKVPTKDLHTTDYTQLYDFLKYNQKEVDELKAERLKKTQDHLALMANSNNPYAFSAPHQDQPSYNQNYMQQPMPNPEDITDPTTAMNMALVLMAKSFKLNYSTPTNNNQRISSNPHNRQIAQPGRNIGQDRQMQMVGVRAERNAAGHNGNQIRCYNCRGVGYFAKNYTVRPKRRDIAYLPTQLLIAQKEEAGIQLQAEEFDLTAAVADLDEIKEVNANCILMANLQQASTSGTQTDKAPVYDSDGSAEYTELLEPIPEPHQVPQNDNTIISKVTSVEQSRETIEQHPANFEETHFKSLAKEADESLAKQKALELEIERLLRAVVSQDIMSVVQKTSVVDTSNLQTELECTKERFENCIIKKENEYAKLWNDWNKRPPFLRTRSWRLLRREILALNHSSTLRSKSNLIQFQSAFKLYHIMNHEDYSSEECLKMEEISNLNKVVVPQRRRLLFEKELTKSDVNRVFVIPKRYAKAYFPQVPKEEVEEASDSENEVLNARKRKKEEIMKRKTKAYNSKKLRNNRSEEEEQTESESEEDVKKIK
nr:hypothetical protein [Tanacetum cinerariifolium]